MIRYPLYGGVAECAGGADRNRDQRTEHHGRSVHGRDPDAAQHGLGTTTPTAPTPTATSIRSRPPPTAPPFPRRNQRGMGPPEAFLSPGALSIAPIPLGKSIRAHPPLAGTIVGRRS